jgi:AcrR family transcriptional regulator
MRPSEGPSTRESILDEATHCFATAGYEGTSLNDIAAGVGIRRPSLLHHFHSKEELYGEVFERLLSTWVTEVEAVAAGPQTGWDKFQTVLEAGFRFFAEHPDAVRLLRREAIDSGTHVGIDLGAALAPLFRAAAGFLEAGMAAGTFRRHDPGQLLITGYGALLSYFSDAPFVAGLLDVDPLSPAALRARFDHVASFFRSALLVE